VAPLDLYGTTEALVPAAGRQGQTGMDILEDLVVLEVVDERNRPVPAGVPDPAGLHVAVVLRESAPAGTRPASRRRRSASCGTPGRSRPRSRSPRARIDRDAGNGAKLKLVRSAVSGR
jgi:hypothetical protein